ncbi:hypothetical protein AGOR_G00188860 [Albula goreensis]|uniref:Uncharacterized protein n=1 Tax=Albula goreensis TaxID=1534307 RepID=A0A8T3CQ34_9TELE|nr:hypothetical protein AGOR_G00188860 [Albula goreensis]
MPHASTSGVQQHEHPKSARAYFVTGWEKKLKHGEDMMILNRLALVLLIACLAQQVLVIDCEKGQGRKGKRDGKGKDSRSPPEKPPGAPSRRDMVQNTQGAKPTLKGKFSTKDKTQCTWLAGEGEDGTFILGVDCQKGGIGFNCEYIAKPATCAQYAPSAKLYWKQIARALKKQKNICADSTALVKSSVCKKGPKDAHFKLSISTVKPPTVRPETTTYLSSDKKPCTEKIDQKKLAEEYCSGSWVTLCNFFFTMVQSDDC